MNFLGIGPLELLVVAALAFFLLGPRKMTEAGRTMGKMLRELREQREEFTSMIMEDIDFEDPPAPRRDTPPRPAGVVALKSDPGDGSAPEGGEEAPSEDGGKGANRGAE